MENVKTAEDIITDLEGKWKSTDNKVSFKFIGTGIVNVVGVVDTYGQDVLEGRYSLDWDEAKEVWLISNQSILKSWKSPIIFSPGAFEIMDGSKWPLVPVSKFTSEP